jgi:hypothetical protein
MGVVASFSAPDAVLLAMRGGCRLDASCLPATAREGFVVERYCPDTAAGSASATAQRPTPDDDRPSEAVVTVPVTVDVPLAVSDQCERPLQRSGTSDDRGLHVAALGAPTATPPREKTPSRDVENDPPAPVAVPQRDDADCGTGIDAALGSDVNDCDAGGAGSGSGQGTLGRHVVEPDADPKPSETAAAAEAAATSQAARIPWQTRLQSSGRAAAEPYNPRIVRDSAPKNAKAAAEGVHEPGNNGAAGNVAPAHAGNVPAVAPVPVLERAGRRVSKAARQRAKHDIDTMLRQLRSAFVFTPDAAPRPWAVGDASRRAGAAAAAMHERGGMSMSVPRTGAGAGAPVGTAGSHRLLPWPQGSTAVRVVSVPLRSTGDHGRLHPDRALRMASARAPMAPPAVSLSQSCRAVPPTRRPPNDAVVLDIPTVDAGAGSCLPYTYSVPTGGSAPARYVAGAFRDAERGAPAAALTSQRGGDGHGTADVVVTPLGGIEPPSAVATAAVGSAAFVTPLQLHVAPDGVALDSERVCVGSGPCSVDDAVVAAGSHPDRDDIGPLVPSASADAKVCVFVCVCMLCECVCAV